MAELIDKDRGWDKFFAQLQAAGMELLVGIGGELGHIDPVAGPKSALPEVATYAAANEFGTRHILSRPFLRSTFAEREGDWSRFLERRLRTVDVISLPVLAQAMGQLGLKAQADVRKKIVDIKHPPNSLETQKRKGARTGKNILINNPLVDTTRMKGAVGWTIRRAV